MTKTEIDHIKSAQNIKNGRLFVPKTEDPVDTVIEILDDPNVERKKTMYSYVPPQVNTAFFLTKMTHKKLLKFQKIF